MPCRPHGDWHRREPRAQAKPWARSPTKGFLAERKELGVPAQFQGRSLVTAQVAGERLNQWAIQGLWETAELCN